MDQGEECCRLKRFGNTGRREAQTRRKRGRFGKALPVIGIILGLVLLSVPLMLSMRADMEAQQSIQSMEDTYNPKDNPVLLKALKEAEKYNRALAGKPVDGKVLPWSKQLEFGGNESNCWIEIPAINLKQPIYKGTSEQALMAGVGINEGTSLPVGGVPSNCVLAGHTGMSDERMFDNIRYLQPGDKLCLHTLGQPFEYEVESTETVLPNQTEHLLIYKKHEDMVTLVTCTPYGVNDHRLLVHCKRIPYNPADFEQGSTPVSAYADNRTLPLLAGLAAVALAAACSAVARHRRKIRQRAAFAGSAETRGMARR